MACTLLCLRVSSPATWVEEKEKWVVSGFPKRGWSGVEWSGVEEKRRKEVSQNAGAALHVYFKHY